MNYTIQDLIEGIMDETEATSRSWRQRERWSPRPGLENIEELVQQGREIYRRTAEHPSLDEFLEQVALVAGYR